MQSFSRSNLAFSRPDSADFAVDGPGDAARSADALRDLPHMLRRDAEPASDAGIHSPIFGELHQLRRDTLRRQFQIELHDFESENNSHLQIVSRGKSLPVRKSAQTDIGARIRQLRKSLGLTQVAFGVQLQVNNGTISKWENGENRPEPDALVRISKLATGIDHVFFLEEAGLGSYLAGEKMPSELRRASTEVVARSLSTSSTFATINETSDVCTIPILERPTDLGNSNAMVSCTLSFPAAWLPQDATVQAVTLSNQISPFFDGEVIALVDISRRDPDRLQGCIVAVRTTDGIEPMTLRKDSSVYFLVPLQDGTDHPVRVLRPSGQWSIVGKVLKWIGNAPGSITAPDSQRQRLKRNLGGKGK